MMIWWFADFYLFGLAWLLVEIERAPLLDENGNVISDEGFR